MQHKIDVTLKVDARGSAHDITVHYSSVLRAPRPDGGDDEKGFCKSGCGNLLPTPH